MRRAVPKEPIPFREYTPHVVPTTPSELAAKIERVQDEIARFIESKVRALKASQDGRNQPVESLRQMLTRHQCPCQAALRLINE